MRITTGQQSKCEGVMGFGHDLVKKKLQSAKLEFSILCTSGIRSQVSTNALDQPLAIAD